MTKQVLHKKLILGVFALFFSMQLFGQAVSCDNQLVGQWTFEQGSELKDLTGNFNDLVLQGGGTVSDGALHVGVNNWANSIGYTGPELKEKTLVAWVRLSPEALRASNPVQGGSILTIDKTNIDDFDGIVFGERQAGKWMLGSTVYKRTLDPIPGFQETVAGELVKVSICYKNNNGQANIQISRNGELIGNYTKGPFTTYVGPTTEIVFGKRHTFPNGALPGKPYVAAKIEEARIYCGCLPVEDIATLDLTPPQVAPEISCPAPIEANSDLGQCGANMTFEAFDEVVNPSSTITYSHEPGSFFPVGETMVTATATNAAGTSECTFKITVKDTEAPSAIAQPVTVFLDETGKATLRPEDVDSGSSDNCEIVSMTLSNTEFGCSTATYSLGFDGTNDQVVMPSGIVEGLTNFTFESWVNYQDNGFWTRIFDIGNNPTVNMFLTAKAGRAPNVGRPRLAITTAGIAGEQLIDSNIPMPTGWNHIAVTLEQIAPGQVVGKMYINAVLVGQNTSMTLTPSSMGITTQNLLGKSQYPDPYLKGQMDEVRIWNVARSQSQITGSLNNALSGNEFGLFLYYSFEDGPGSGIAKDLSPSGNDGTLINMNTNTSWITPGVINTLGVGSHPITLTVTDNSGNISTATTTVEVKDEIAPTVVCKELTIFLDENGEAAISEIDVVDSYNDNCNVKSITLSQSTFDASNLGVNEITVTVEDVSGNKNTCLAKVTLVDLESPTISCPESLEAIATSADGAVVTYDAPTGADNSGLVIVNFLSGLESGAVFTLGETLVTYEAIDASGNRIECSFTVTISGIAPEIICPAPIEVNNESGQCGAIVAFEAFDEVGNPASTITYSHEPGSFFPVGITTVTATATNSIGSSECTFTVTVNDTEAPTLSLKDAVVQLDPSGNGTLNIQDVNNGTTDNCTSADQITFTLSQTQFSCNDLGEIEVEVTAEDAAGLTSSQMISVNVLEPVTPISVSVSSNVQPNAKGNIVIFSNAPASLGFKSSVMLTASGIPASFTGLTYQWFVNTSEEGGQFTEIQGATSSTLTIQAQGDFTSRYQVVVSSESGCIAESANPIKVISVEASCGKNDGKKVSVCHLPPGNKGNRTTICVSINAVDKLLENSPGSYIGSCDISYRVDPEKTVLDAIQPEIEGFKFNKELPVGEFLLYPNPATQEANIYVELDQAAKVAVRVYDSVGRLVYDSSLQAERSFNHSIPVESLSSGMYTVQVIAGDMVMTKRLIKK